jgi:hypothetical protein
MKGIAVSPSIDDVKSMARRLRAVMEARGLAATHSDTLEFVAAQLGFRDWNTASATLNANESGGAHFTRSAPVLLSLDEAKCREFYCNFLGFEIAFEHRFAPHMPVYLGFRRGSVELHLSPHRGDATTGSAVFVWMTNVDDYRRELTASGTRFPVPEAVDQTWGREFTVADPFGNRLRFCERPANGAVQRQAVVDDAEALRSRGGDMSHDAATFDDVGEIGAQLPDVKATADRLGVALRIGREILACTAIHKSAEPDSLMVRLGFERRDALVAENPNAFYLTAHYEPYPVVLVRLSRVSRAYLGALLTEAREFDRGESK